MMNPDAATTAKPPLPSIVQPHTVLRKAAWRLLPFLCLLYVLNLLDRTNVGFARLTMQPELGLGDEVFLFGYGIFYFGYLLFEVPANLLLRRIGARRWIARIMITWGLVSCATLAVTGVWSFYAVRILLGVAEAGFFPGIVLYLTYWFPARQRARMMALFMIASPLSGVIGNPLSGIIMQYSTEYFSPIAQLHGWQWLFLVEGIPSIIIGVMVLFYLPDRPADARWLSTSERDWLSEHLRIEESERRRRHGADRLMAMAEPRVWLLICIYATVAVGANAGAAQFATILAGQFEDMSKSQLGLLVAVPSVCGVISMIGIGALSDHAGERRRPMAVAFAAFVAACGWSVSSISDRPWLTLAGLCVAQSGMMGMLPTFWALPTAFLTGAAAAGGIALINSVANIGGLFGPNILGLFGMPTIAGILFIGGLLALWVRTDSREPNATNGK